MRWRINGADRGNGQGREFWIEATSEDEARQAAAELGVVVSSVLKDPPAVVSVPREVVLNSRQFKALRVTEMRIASGVCLALIMWTILCVLVTLAALVWMGNLAFAD